MQWESARGNVKLLAELGVAWVTMLSGRSSIQNVSIDRKELSYEVIHK